MFRMRSVENNPELKNNSDINTEDIKRQDDSHLRKATENDASFEQQQEYLKEVCPELLQDKPTEANNLHVVENDESQNDYASSDISKTLTKNNIDSITATNGANNKMNADNEGTDVQSVHSAESINSRRLKKWSSQSSEDDESTPLTSSTEDRNSKRRSQFKRYNSCDQEDQSFQPESSQKFKKLAAFATISKWWKKNVDRKISNRKNKEKMEELKMRYKLQYHFMSPFDKYKLGRKPWKLGIQLLKIILVTTQVLLFGADRFASVAFLKNTHKSFKYIFIPEYDGNPSFSLYSRQQLVSTIQNVQEKYETLTNISIGKYWHVSNPIPPVQLCEEKINVKLSDWGSKNPITTCWNISRNTNYSRMLDSDRYFDRIRSIDLLFKLKAVYLNGMILHHRPECLTLSTTVSIDNKKHDGRMRVNLLIEQTILDNQDDDTCFRKYVRKKDTNSIRQILIAFDVLVITICSMSAFLCLRSVFKSILLAKAAEQYFEKYRHENLTKWDKVELINKWFPVIASSDLLSITGSIYKIYVDKRDIRYYNLSSLFLGVGVILVWIGFLRFFVYLKEYNMLLITVRAAAPSLLQFMFCAMFIFFGFTFCGWVVLGAYHEKFKTFLTTAECLFSLVNGDDMYPTFSAMPNMNIPVWIFSKVYIYVFVSLFIYVVLSTFISIVGDAYERLKDYGRMPPTRIECFITGQPLKFRENKSVKRHGACAHCERESLRMNAENNSFPSGLMNRKTLSDSQLSLVSASLE